MCVCPGKTNLSRLEVAAKTVLLVGYIRNIESKWTVLFSLASSQFAQWSNVVLQCAKTKSVKNSRHKQECSCPLEHHYKYIGFVKY